MPAELEQFTSLNGTEVTAFAFTGARQDIWHRLGQSFDGRAMTAEEAMRESHMNRLIRIVPMNPPGQWAVPEQYFVVLEGDTFITPDNDFVVVPDKVVGIHGKGGADAHANFTVRDRFILAEEAIHASHEQAVWSTAGSLRDGTQGFATMLAPPIVIDPHGICDVINQYLTLVWSYDGSRSTELGSSEIRAVCANTVAMHDLCKQVVIKVRHTSHTAEQRFRLAAEQWAMAQDKAKALKLRAERMLTVRGKQDVLTKIIERFEPTPAESASKRALTLHKQREEAIRVVSYADTNDVGDNGWAAWNAFVEYLDWEAQVKCGEGESIADRRLANQFDGTYDEIKSRAADLVLAMAD